MEAKEMAYEGEILDQCGLLNIDFSTTHVVAVSGDGPNVCGHLLLYAGNQDGIYFHVAGLRTYPHYMDPNGFRRYLRETGKRELARRLVDIPYPDKAYLELESQLADKWTWLVLPHNCVTFCEDIISAGGGEWGSYSNCPALATTDSLDARLRSAYVWMSSNINNLYGVPQ
jgi:hypothetical protein